MAFFLSTFTNKIDKKGRVSVPASFRTAVAASHFPGIVVFPSLHFSCMEGSDFSYLEDLAAKLDSDLGPFNPDQIKVSTAILGGSDQLAFDSEGRVMLPAALRERAGIDSHVTFVGIGKKFQLWNPDAYEVHQKEALAAASEAAPGFAPFGRSAGGQ